MEDWQNNLRQIADEHPEAPGELGEKLRAVLVGRASTVLMRDIQLAHCRVREAVITGMRQSLRCGSLLLQAPGDLAGLLQAAGITPQAAIACTQLALRCTADQRRRSLRRRAVITEEEALVMLESLRGSEEDGSDPLSNLEALSRIRAHARD
jgi:hypothetical protein